MKKSCHFAGILLLLGLLLPVEAWSVEVNTQGRTFHVQGGLYTGQLPAVTVIPNCFDAQAQAYYLPTLTLDDTTHFSLDITDQGSEAVVQIDAIIPDTPGYYVTGLTKNCGFDQAVNISHTMWVASEPEIVSVDKPFNYGFDGQQVPASVNMTLFADGSFRPIYQVSVDGGKTWSGLGSYSSYAHCERPHHVEYIVAGTSKCWSPYLEGQTAPYVYDGLVDVEITMEDANYALREGHGGAPFLMFPPEPEEYLFRFGYPLSGFEDGSSSVGVFGAAASIVNLPAFIAVDTVPTETPPRVLLQPGETVALSWDLFDYPVTWDNVSVEVGFALAVDSHGLPQPACTLPAVIDQAAGTVNVTVPTKQECGYVEGNLGPWYPYIYIAAGSANAWAGSLELRPKVFSGTGAPVLIGDLQAYLPGEETDHLKNKKKNSPGMCGTPDCSLGDPVDLRSGQFFTHKPLVTVQGAIPVEFLLDYSSFNPQDQGVGFGWSHSFQTAVALNGSEAVVTWPGGRVTRYDDNGDGSYTPRTGDLQDRLTHVPDGSWTLVDRQRNRYRFAAAGQLVQKFNRLGDVLNLGYVAGLLDTVTEPVSGRFLQFSYDADNRLASVSSAGAGTVGFAYDGNGDLVSITDPLDGTTLFTYDAAHRLLSETDPNGNTLVTNSYDAEGRVVAQADADGNPAAVLTYQPLLVRYEDPLGSLFSYVFDESGLREQTGPTGLRVRHSYDAFGNRTGETDPVGGVTSFGYDADGYLTSRTDPLGHTTSFTYDADHNLTAWQDALGNETRYEYDSANRLVRVTDAKGQVTTRTYNADGQLETVTDPADGVTTFAYTSGLLTAMTDPTGRTTTFSYDAAGRLLTETDPLDQTTHYSYDLKGNLLTQTDPDSRVTSYSYDANGNLLTVTDALNRITRYGYDSRNNLITVTDPLSQVTTHSYDAANRRLATTDPAGNLTRYQYDRSGRLLKLQVGELSQTLAYDDGGRLKAESGFQGTFAYQYDAMERLTARDDGEGNRAQFSYDSLGNPIGTVDPLGRTTTYAYDALGRVTGVQDPQGGLSGQEFMPLGLRATLQDAKGVTTAFGYDAAGRLTQVSVDGASTVLAYDEAGRLKTRTNARGQTATYSYSPAGLVTGLSDPSGTVTHSYDAVGNLLSSTDPAGSFSMTYDDLDRLTSYTDVYGNTIGYGYDAAGNLALLTYPDNKTVAYAYTSAGLLASVTDWAGRTTRYSYNSRGELTQVSFADGTSDSYVLDDAGRITAIDIKAPDASPLYQLTYQHDAAGQVVAEGGLPGLPAAPAATMAYTGNRLTAFNGQPVGYDADGNMTSGPLAGGFGAYSYDARGRLVQAGTTGYSYDAADRRVAVDDNGTVTRLVVDPGQALSQILMETDANGTPIAWYVYGLGLVGRESAAGDYHSYHYDLRGSTLALTDSGGAVTDSYQYGLYGQLAASSGATPQPFRYNGRDGVSTDGNGLYHMRARYYQPEARRFVSLDPLLGSLDEVKSLNRYAYVGGDPVRLVDPAGESPVGGAPARLVEPEGGGDAPLSKAEVKARLIAAGKRGDKVALKQWKALYNTMGPETQRQKDTVNLLKAKLMDMMAAEPCDLKKAGLRQIRVKKGAFGVRG